MLALPCGAREGHHLLGVERLRRLGVVLTAFVGLLLLDQSESGSLVKPTAIRVDELRMGNGGVLAPRVYRIPAWPVRILVPLVAAVVILGLLHEGATAAVPIPIVLAAAWIYAGERCGLVVTSDGLESRMARRENRFRYAWTNIDGFELVDSGAQVAIAVRLRDGSRTLLPSTRAWSWNQSSVRQIYAALAQEQAAARTT